MTKFLKSLAEQAREWRSKFEDWESLISKRRRDLSEDDYVVVSDTRIPSGQTQASDAHMTDRSQSGASQQNSRPVTPRGASIGSPAFGSIDGALSASPNPRSGLVPRPMSGSPLRKSYFPQEAEQTTTSRSVSNVPSASYLEDLLRTQLQLSTEKASEEGAQSLSLLTRGLQAERSASTEASSLAIFDETDSGAITPNPTDNESIVERSHASLSHILTNAIILQEFILEIAAVIQARGTMFGEVDLKQ